MEKRFNALRVIGTVFKVFAWIVLVVGVLFALITFLIAIFSGAAASRNDMGPMAAFGFSGVIFAGFTLIITATDFLMLYAAGEAIFLALAIEENTRESSLLLRNQQMQR